MRYACYWQIKDFNLRELREVKHYAAVQMKVCRMLDGEPEIGIGEEVYWRCVVEQAQLLIDEHKARIPAPTRTMPIAEAKSRADILEVIGRYMDLRKAGRQYAGKCPFHSSRYGDNFFINPELGKWHCFSCGKHGDVLDFIQQIEGVNVKEACALV